MRPSDREIGERVAASYVVRGRLRRTAGGERALTLDLSAIDSLTQLWSERLMLPLGDPVEIGDAVVARVAASLSARIDHAALQEARRRPASGLEVWELTLRGLFMIREGTRASDDAAREIFLKALALDPLYARAHAGLALSWFNEWSCQFWDRFEEASRQAYVHARRALELDDRDAMIHLVIAKVALYRSEWEQSAWYLDRALMLCPNAAELLVQAAVLKVYLGRPDVAVGHVERAMDLNPLHPNVYYLIAAFARVITGDYAGALALRARSDAMPFVDAAAYVAAAEAMLGRMAELKAEFARYVAEYSEKIAFGEPFPPEAPLDWLFEINSFRRPEDLAMLRDAFARIGQAVASVPPTPFRERHPSDTGLRLARDGGGWSAESMGSA